MSKITERCPECQTFLSAMPLSAGSALACRACAGVCINLAVLKQHAGDATVQALWARARDSGHASDRPCPSCERGLRTFDAGAEGDALQLDACPGCQLLWFDGQELERAGVALSRPSAKRSEASDAKALMDARMLHDNLRAQTTAELVRFLMRDAHRILRRW
jgi:Zn-finger nucleic acid-binding protein